MEKITEDNMDATILFRGSGGRTSVVQGKP